MRKRLAVTLIFVLSALCGCAKTPEQAVVREKGDHGIEGYQEETEVQGEPAGETETGGADVDGLNGAEPAGDSGDADSASGTGGEDFTDGSDGDVQQATGGTDMPASSETNVLAQKLQAPEVYQASVSSEDGAFSLNCDAKVFIPDVEKVPVYRVTQKEFSQEFIDRATNAFFGDAPVYDADYLYGETRAEIEERLNKLKSYMAAGIPKDYYASLGFTDEFSEEEAYELLQAEIDSMEEKYQEAPETIEKVEARPALEDDGNGSASFFGYVENGDENYTYYLKRYSGTPMEITVRRLCPEISKGAVVQFSPVPGRDSDDAETDGEPTRGEMEAEAGITQDEAAQKAEEYLEALDLAQDFSCGEVELVRGLYNEFTSNSMQTAGYGWQVNCTRDVDGFPITNDLGVGGGLESMESTIEPWCYEHVSFVIGKEGLLQAEIINLYEVGERRMENVKLLPFSEIAGIFEQMMQIKNADMSARHQNWIKYDIARAALGYVRIYDPTVDSRTGTLVPAWDFFGSSDVEIHYDGETSVAHISDVGHSVLTINAADGTVIDRSLGY